MSHVTFTGVPILDLRVYENLIIHHKYIDNTSSPFTLLYLESLLAEIRCLPTRLIYTQHYPLFPLQSPSWDLQQLSM